MTTTNTKSRGFTIVELLIVIVIIAILAAITIAAYTGITNRAKNNGAQSASSALAKKIEVYNAENGQYPNTAGTITGTGTQNGVATSTSSTWYSADGTAFKIITAAPTSLTTAPAAEKNVYYKANGTAGGCVYYYSYTGSQYLATQVGTATCVSPATALTDLTTNAVAL